MVCRESRGHSLKIALLVDGQTDRNVIRILVEKLFATRDPKPALVFRVLPRGDFFSAEKICAYFSPLVHEHSDLSKVVLCLDCECTPPSEIQRKLSPVQSELRRRHATLTPTYCLKVHAVESWLASDRTALRGVLGQDPPQFPKAETVCRPKALLDEVFRKAGRDFLYVRDDERLAKAVDVETVSRESASFSGFRQTIEDP